MPDLAGRRVICGDGAIGKTCVLNRYMYSNDDDVPCIKGLHDWTGEAELGSYGLQACKVTLRAMSGAEAFNAINNASSRGPLCH
jgi:GTPase SAR1 family protein